jgi:N-methylhydantoinase B
VTAVSEEPSVVWDGRTHSYRPGPDWRDGVSPDLEFHVDADEDLDPITYAVIRNRMWSSNMAHGETLTRISGSPVFQALDFNMCILTEDAEVVTNAPFQLYLDAGAPLSIRYIMQHLSGAPGIEEGDMFLVNDPWIGAVHQMDVMICCPVFVEGKLFAWVSNAGHQYDLGGIVPGGWPQNAPDVYHDPVRFSPIKIVERGELRPDLEQMYRRQSRMPDLVALDLRAQLGGCEFAARELTEACEQFGAATVKAAMRRVIDDAQRSFQEKLLKVPDGRYSSLCYFDEKMPGDTGNYRMQVNVTKRGDRLTFDNEGTDPQQEGPIGFVYSAFSGSALASLSITVLWEHIFALGGAERQIDFKPTPGLLTCVDFPAPVSGGVVNAAAYQQAVLALINRMLATDPKLKQDMTGVQPPFPLMVLAGLNDRGEAIGQAIFDAAAAGSAAKPGRDGVDTNGPNWSPLMRLLNVEALEQFFPVVYIYRRERVDGGGVGKWRGGTGMDAAFVAYRAKHLEAITNTGGESASTQAAIGLFGGYPSPSQGYRILKGTDIAERFARRELPVDVDDLDITETVRLRGKSNGTELGEGDVLEIFFSGGGGYGDPLQRDPEAVARDISLGYTALATATDVYGVAFDDEGEVDAGKTAERRETLLAERRGWTPASDRPGSATAFEPQTDATGEPDRSVHEYIVAGDREGRRVLCCAECDAVLTDYRANYKLGLLVADGPFTLVPRGEDPKQFLDVEMVVRRFCCPGCGVLMATDVVRASEPIFADTVFV